MPTATPKKTTRQLEDENQQSALATLAGGLAGTPSAGTTSAIKSGNEAVAQFANQQRGAAAKQAAKTGALGQGTAVGLTQAVNQSTLGRLAETQAANNRLISDEQKSFMDTAINIGQGNKTMDEQKRQFDESTRQFNVTSDTQKSQFDKTMAQNQGQFESNLQQRQSEFTTTAGQSQQQINAQKEQFTQSLNLQKDQLAQQAGIQNLDALMKLGGDIPAVASKVMNQVLGNAGMPLTSNEKADLDAWYKEQKAKGEKIDAQTEKLINSMIEQTAGTSALNQLATQNANDQLAAQNISRKLASGQSLTPEEIELGKTSGAIPQVNPQNGPQGDAGVKEFLQKNPSGLINLNGKVYKVDKALTNIGGVGGIEGTPTRMYGMDGNTYYLVGGQVVKSNKV